MKIKPVGLVYSSVKAVGEQHEWCVCIHAAKVINKFRISDVVSGNFQHLKVVTICHNLGNVNKHSYNLMAYPDNAIHLQKQTSFKFDIRSLIIFLLTGALAWAINLAPQMGFGGSITNFWMRTTFILVADALLLLVTFHLFKRNSIPTTALGLNVTKRLYKNALIGMGIAIATIITMAIMLYLFVPYRFLYKSLNVGYVLKESYSFLLGALLEEMLFRGFLLVFFSKLLGWRIGLLILALPFGLYHLAGGITLVTSTTMFSFVFGLSFVLTGSLWTAIFVHATANILLHAITGLDGGGNSVYTLAFEGQIPNYPFGLLVSVSSALIMASVLYLVIVRRQRIKIDTPNHQ